MTTLAVEAQHRRPQGIMIALGMFLMGGIGLAYEYTFSKLAADLLGNSAQQWAIIIGIMMFFMGIGADVQKYLSGRDLVGKLILSEIGLGILGGFGPIILLWAFGHWNTYFVLLQYGFICTIGVLIGFEIPLVTRINEGYSQELRYNLARILKMDYIGALAGALVWIFVLPKWFTLVEMAMVLGIFNMGVAGLTLWVFRDRVAHVGRLAVVIVVVTIGLGIALANAEPWTVNAEQALYEDPMVFRQTSPYQHVVMTKSSRGALRCYINGHLQFNSEDEYIYHEHLVHPAMHLAPRREKVLILGGGDALALREVLKYKDVKEVTMVDLDPMITELAATHPDLVSLNGGSLANAKVTVAAAQGISGATSEKLYVPNERIGRLRRFEHVANVKVINIDAALFAASTKGRFDVIIMDFPDPNALELAKLYSLPFYTALKERLAVGGIMVQQSTSPVHAKEAFLCIGRTMKAAGFSMVPFHDNVPSFGEWGWWIGGHDHAYSPDGLIKSMRNLAELKVETQYLTPSLVGASTEFGRHQLQTEYDGITTYSDPRAYQFYLMGWKQSF